MTRRSTERFLAQLSEQSQHANVHDRTIAQLEAEVQRERDGRNEERFLFVLSVTVLLDLYFFTLMDGWAGPAAILLLELVFLVALGRRLGIEEIAVMCSRLLDRVPFQRQG